jgi:exosortase
MRRWLWLLPFTLAFAPTLAWFAERWTDGVFRNGHGIFMPFIVGYFVWEYLKQDTDPEPRSSPVGWLFLGTALGLLVLDSAIHSQLLSGAAFVLSLPGIALLLLGAKRTRGIAFPLLIAVFMLPIPAGALTRLYLVLRTMTAVVSSHLVPLFGVPVDRDGTLLRLPHSLVEVADNCSGFATLYAGILAAIVLAHMSRSPWRRAAVLLAVVPLALVCNFLRVSVLVLLVHGWGPGILDTQLHPLSGMLLFVLVIGALLLIAGRDALRGQPGTVRTPLSDRWATALFAVCALALAPVVAHTYLHWQRDDCANPTALVPAMSGDGAFAARDAQMRHDFGSIYQWREGRIAPANGAPELSYVVIRSYDPKMLYYRGTRRMWKDVSTSGDTLEWLETDEGRLPVVRSQTSNANPRAPKTVIAALLVYGGEPVDRGWLAQLRAAPGQVVSGARPMTFFAVRGDAPEALLPATEERAHQWLLDSWRNYRAICGG